MVRPWRTGCIVTISRCAIGTPPAGGGRSPDAANDREAHQVGAADLIDSVHLHGHEHLLSSEGKRSSAAMISTRCPSRPAGGIRRSVGLESRSNKARQIRQAAYGTGT